MIKPFLRTTVDGLDIMGDPSVDRLTIEGPFAATGSGDTASRRKIFICNRRTADDGLRDADPVVARPAWRTAALWTRRRSAR